MGIKQLYNDNLRKLPNKYGDVSVMAFVLAFALALASASTLKFLGPHYFQPFDGFGLYLV